MLWRIEIQNMVNNATWTLTDLLIASPLIMSHILDKKNGFSPLDINPKVVIIDEFDKLI